MDPRHFAISPIPNAVNEEQNLKDFQRLLKADEKNKIL